MSENSELNAEPTSEQPDLNSIFGFIRRRRLQFLVPLFCGWLLIWGASWILSAKYRSSTLILVEEPTMPENYVAPNISDDMQARLESMTQQILSRTRLLVIIDKLHLYAGTPSPDDRVEAMRKDIGVDLVRNTKNSNITAFKVNYTAKDPHMAQAVTSELTSLFITENLKTREREAEGTTSFIQKQLDDARASLAEQEAKVKQFEGQHLGEMPTQQASNLQILAGLQAQLQSEQDALNTAKQQRAYLQAMVEQERAAQSKTLSGTGNAGGSTDLTTIDQQLEKMRAQLAELSSRYTDNYPDVQSVKSQIAKAEVTRARVVAAMKQRSADPKAEESSPSGVVDPAQGAAFRQLQGQLQANQVEIGNREKSITELNGRIGQYQGRLNLAPATEQQLADLTRGYEQSKANYDDLLKKRDQSQMATSMEQMQQGERFTMLDPPSLPLKPDFPNHLKFFGIGLGVGFALGLVVAGAFEFLDDRLHSEDEIKGLLPVLVLSEIPEIVNAVDEQNSQKRARFEWAATAAVLLIMLAGAVFSFLHG